VNSILPRQHDRPVNSAENDFTMTFNDFCMTFNDRDNFLWLSGHGNCHKIHEFLQPVVSRTSYSSCHQCYIHHPFLQQNPGWFDILVPDYPDSSGKSPLKWILFKFLFYLQHCVSASFLFADTFVFVNGLIIFQLRDIIFISINGNDNVLMPHWWLSCTICKIVSCCFTALSAQIGYTMP